MAACLLSVPTTDGHTVMCGCEWYQPTTRTVRRSSAASRSASVAPDISWFEEISTRSFRLSSRTSALADSTWHTPPCSTWRATGDSILTFYLAIMFHTARFYAVSRHDTAWVMTAKFQNIVQHWTYLWAALHIQLTNVDRMVQKGQDWKPHSSPIWIFWRKTWNMIIVPEKHHWNKIFYDVHTDIQG